MSLQTVLTDLADSTEALARTLRMLAAEVQEERRQVAARPNAPADSALARALKIHPAMGLRQRELISLVEQEGTAGAETGMLSKAMDYDQSNVYLTLHNLMKRGFIRKDTSVHPHRYYLGPALDQ